MDYWIDGLMDCCKSRRYAQTLKQSNPKCPFQYFYLTPAFLILLELKPNNPVIQKSINPSSCGMTVKPNHTGRTCPSKEEAYDTLS
jgi:hypothetical protein